jgi:hypothetical protein
MGSEVKGREQSVRCSENRDKSPERGDTSPNSATGARNNAAFGTNAAGAPQSPGQPISATFNPSPVLALARISRFNLCGASLGAPSPEIFSASKIPVPKTMKASINPLRSFIFVTALSVPLFTASAGKNWMAGFQEGKPPLQSVGQLAFGPDGILFLADSKGAAIVAFSTGDTQAPSAPVSAPLKVERVNEKVAALLGTTPDEVLIEDLAVNPISRNAYLAVSRGRGPTAAPVIIRVGARKDLEVVSLDKVKFSRAELPNAPIDGVVGDVKKTSNPRMESITDIAFLNDRVLIAGLSNEEFSSTLRAIAFPVREDRRRHQC